jgi:hypothetical protein
MIPLNASKRSLVSTRAWRLLLCGYAVVVLTTAGAFFSGRQSEPVAVVAGLILLGLPLTSLYSGDLFIARHTLSPTNYPLTFWLFIPMHAAVGVLFVLMGLGVDI